MCDETTVFDLIHCYTRAEAIADGDLVDVTATAREAGIKCPVALTRAVWAEYVALTKAAKKAGNDPTGRLWDILYIFRTCARGTSSSEMRFQLRVVTRSVRPTLVTLKALIGPGDDEEAVITIMMPEED